MLSTCLSMIPILCILIGLLCFHLSAIRVSAIAFLGALLITFFYYKVDAVGLSISMSKGFGLAIFVVLIIWAAIFLYNLVNQVGALEVINKNIEIIIRDKFIQFILLSWIFSSFLQGIAGFGVPVIVVTPILIGMGFNPVVSAAAVLVGHSWAISFGSMGSSIYAIDMVTYTNIGDIVIYMTLFGTIAMFCTGVSVNYIYGGIKYLLKGLPYIIVLAIVMGGMLFLLAYMEMLSIIGLIVGLTGIITLLLIYKIPRKNRVESITLYKSTINIFQAALPYFLIIIISLLFNVLNPNLAISFSYTGYETGLGRIVDPEDAYVKFNILKYPFTVIIFSSAISMIVYKYKKILDWKITKNILSATVKKCVPTTITIIFLLNMAVLMMDSGMIDQIAKSLVHISRGVYPIVAPFIGILGAFVTGSNTNSNIIFGSLQEIAANTIGASTAIMCAVQSIGASVGGAIGPTTVSLSATAAHIQGRESEIYRKTLVPILIIILVLGIVNMIMI